MSWTPFFLVTVLLLAVAVFLNFGFGGASFRELVTKLRETKGGLLGLILLVILAIPFGLLFIQS